MPSGKGKQGNPKVGFPEAGFASSALVRGPQCEADLTSISRPTQVRPLSEVSRRFLVLMRKRSGSHDLDEEEEDERKAPPIGRVARAW